MRNRIILAVATVLILAIGLMAGHHNLEGTSVIYLQGSGIRNYIALPYNNTISPQTGAGLRNSIIAAGGTGVVVYNWTGTVWQTHAPCCYNFPLVPGVGYKVTITNTTPLAWTVEGTHNPATSISLTANISKIIALPYDTPTTSALLLRNEIMDAGGTGVSVYNWDGTSWQRYSGGGIGQLDFGIEPGTAYLVKSASSVSAWVPATN